MKETLPLQSKKKKQTTKNKRASSEEPYGKLSDQGGSLVTIQA